MTLREQKMGELQRLAVLRWGPEKETEAQSNKSSLGWLMSLIEATSRLHKHCKKQQVDVSGCEAVCVHEAMDSCVLLMGRWPLRLSSNH